MVRLFGSLGVFTQSAIVCISLIAVALHVRWTRKSASLGPTLLTTFGIFFCFCGIAWGLLDFNPATSREASRSCCEAFGRHFGRRYSASVGANHQVASAPPWSSAFAERRHNGRGDCRRFSSAAQPAQPIHRGTDDSTLLGQVKLLRTEANDRLDRLNQSYQHFAEKVAEANSKALIQALSEVIRTST